MKRSVLLLAVLLVGCEKTRYSDELMESATVEDVVYVPATHGTGVGPAFGTSASGQSVSTIAIVSVDTKPEYATVFLCGHGKFIVRGEETWRSSRRGDQVVVHYREVYKCRDDKCRLVDYDFLRAEEAIRKSPDK